MDRYVIRTSETDSVTGVASTQHIDVELKQTTKTLPFPNVSTTLSQRSIYEEERQAGSKFRLIVTIMPYCTNVLFNALTEIIKDEGSDSVKVVTDVTNTTESNDENEIKDTYGNTKPTRVQMISNTEYSSEEHGGYEYHPGYDFFDNHLLRNTSFKVVNIPSSTNSSTDDRLVFNTLEDYMRDRNGEVKKYVPRLSMESIGSSQKFNGNKHLYLHDDILSIEDSINENLYDDNGWWGFTNNTNIDTKELESRKWYSMDIGKALNNHKACEFIDMYPDRTLYSFAPKFNKFTHENEYNWHIVITYPYKNIYNHPICLGGSSYIKRSTDSDGKIVEDTVSEGNRWMGLKVLSAKLTSINGGSKCVVFRTYTKHGLERGDIFYLYYTNPYSSTDDKCCNDTLDGSEIYYESRTYFKANNIGDTSGNNREYYFYNSSTKILEELYKSYLLHVAKSGKDPFDGDEICYKKDNHAGIYDAENNLKTDLLEKILNQTNFRIRRCRSGVKSTYYIRQFRRIPNRRAAKREMTDEEKLHTSKFNGVFDNYVKDNCMEPTGDGEYQRTFNCENYQLAFASTIFNDNAAQYTFTDGIDTDGLTDNLGRPLSEIYYTIVKNNAGHESWYDNQEYDESDVEFSHCFGKLTSGFEMYVDSSDSEGATVPYDYWKKLSSVHHITNVVNSGGVIDEDDISNSLDKDSSLENRDINYMDTFFMGDLVEFNAYDFEEKQLSKVMHRFNTAQRETVENEHYSQYQFHEILADDYDYDINNETAFNVKEYSAVNGSLPTDAYDDDSEYVTNDYATITRPEGYYYQAHYPIKIREYTNIKQGSHYTLKVKRAKPIQRDGILIQVTTSNSHGVAANDLIFICDDNMDTWYVTRCVRVIDKNNFLMLPDYFEYVINATDFEDKTIESNLDDAVMNGGERYKQEMKYKKRFSWLQLCEILNGVYSNDLTYPDLTLRRKNKDIPDYAAYIGGNKYLWRNIVNIGDSSATELEDYIFANGYFYVTQRINFFLKRQDPFATNGLYFDGEDRYPYFPNDPSGAKQSVNDNVTKDTTVSC